MDRRKIKKDILEFESLLEKEHKLITEAIGDVIAIAKLNNSKDAAELIRTQFIVIDRQDLEEDS